MAFPQELEDAIEIARSTRGRDGRGFFLAAIGIRTDGAKISAVNGWNIDVEPRHHAEARAIRKLDSGAILYVARIRKDGSVAMSRPCKSCQNLLKSRRVAKVYFTIDDGSWGAMNIATGEEIIRT